MPPLETLLPRDPSIIITNPTSTEFIKIINKILFEINRWFQSNLLFLNHDKTYFMQLLTKKNKEIDMQVSFANKHISNIHSTKFLFSTIDTSMSWKDQIKELMSKLNKACYAIRSIKHLFP